MTQERVISPFGLELLGKLTSSEIINAFISKGWVQQMEYFGPILDDQLKIIGETVGVEREFPLTKQSIEDNCVGEFVWIRRYINEPNRLVIVSNAKPFIVDLNGNRWKKKLEVGIKRACDKPGCYMDFETSGRYSEFVREEKELIR